jgi:MerR family mercuric resistance operon transcriptional regulator
MRMNRGTTMRIGQVAAEAGVNVQTLRFYERRGLLKEPQRRESGYREYDPDTVRLVRFIKRAQELGFTLREVEELLRLRETEDVPCGEVRAAATSKLEDIESKLKSLRAMKRALTALVDSCATEGTPRHCPILEALDDGGGRR